MSSKAPKKRGRPPTARNELSVKRIGYRPGEFAGMTGLHPVTVWRWIRTGKIPVVDENGVRLIPHWYIERYDDE